MCKDKSSTTLYSDVLFLCRNASGVSRVEGGLGGSNPPSPKFRRPSKIVSNSTRLRKLLKIAELGRQHPKIFGKKAVKF